MSSTSRDLISRHRWACYISNVNASPQSADIVPILPQVLTPAESRPYLRYIARQPILDREQNTYGYELLFRSGPDNFLPVQ